MHSHFNFKEPFLNKLFHCLQISLKMFSRSETPTGFYSKSSTRRRTGFLAYVQELDRGLRKKQKNKNPRESALSYMTFLDSHRSDSIMARKRNGCGHEWFSCPSITERTIKSRFPAMIRRLGSSSWRRRCWICWLRVMNWNDCILRYRK